MITQKDLDDFDKDEEKDASCLQKKRARGLERVGFIIALSAMAFVLGMSFINNCLIWSRNLELYYRFAKICNRLAAIGYTVGLVGMIISIVGYVRSDKNEVGAKVYSAVGIVLGAILTWYLITYLLNLIIQR